MSRFVIKGIEAVKGRQQFKQLIIVGDNDNIDKLQLEISKSEAHNSQVDEGKIEAEKIEIIFGVLDSYKSSLQKAYESSYRGIITYMNLVADLQSVPKTKFRYFPDAKQNVKEFEFKNGDLRVYGIDIFGGKLILYCGYKNKQPQDIIKFRSLKSQFLETHNVKNIENEKRRIN